MTTGLVFYIGFMACGKSTLGEQDAGKAGARFTDLDKVIEENTGKPAWQLLAEKGEKAFRNIESRLLRQVVEKWMEDGKPSQIVACGGGTPCFHGNLDLMKSYGHVVFIDTPLDTILERIALHPEKWPLLKDNDPVVLYGSRRKWYEKADEQRVP